MTPRLVVLSLLACLAMAGFVTTGYHGILRWQQRDADKAYRAVSACFGQGALPSHHDDPANRIADLLLHPEGADRLKRLDGESNALAFDELGRAVHFFRVHPAEPGYPHTSCLTSIRLTGPALWQRATVSIPDYFAPVALDLLGSRVRLAMTASKEKDADILESRGWLPGATYAATFLPNPETVSVWLGNPKPFTP